MKKYPKGVSEEDILSWALAINEERFKRSDYFTSPNAPKDYFRSLLATEEREKFIVVALDNQHGVLEHKTLFEGTIDGASVYPREVVKYVLSVNAAAVMFVHNHPSGSPAPSEADKWITNKLKDALSLIDVRVLDHLVVGGATVVSFAELGYL